VGEIDGQETEDAIGREGAVGDQTMQVGMKVDQCAEGLDGQDAAGEDVLAEQRAVDFGNRFPGERWQSIEQAAMETEEKAQAFGNRPDELSMGNRQADILGDVEAEEESALLGATGADAALLAGKGDEELVMAVGAAGAGEAVLEVAAFEKGSDGLVDDRPPEAELAGVSMWVDGTEIAEVLADEAVEIGLKRLALAIGSGARTGEANHGGPRGLGSIRLRARR